MKRSLAVVAVVVLAACGKASETAAEKMIESQMSKDGTQAKVDMYGGGMKISTTDASGKVSQMEMGMAKVSETDLGLPFYPGTQPKEGEMSKLTTPDGSMVTVMLHSADAPDKVAGFYREQLKARAQGKQFTDASADTTYTMSLNDEPAKQITQVMVMKSESQGSDIQITAHKGTAK